MAQRREFIILADDDEDDRMFFSMALDTLNKEIDLMTFNDGEALLRYKESTSDLPRMVFLDINMPRRSGFDCLKEIRIPNGWVDVPVAMYSTSSNDLDVTKSIDLGAQAFIVKPLELKTLAEMIGWMLNIDWKTTKLSSMQYLVSERAWKNHP